MSKFFEPVIKDIDKQVELMLANPEHRERVKVRVATSSIAQYLLY